MIPEYEIDFTDNAYQQRLPMHARTTVAMALKNNLRQTELLADRNNIHTQEKVGFNILPAHAILKYRFIIEIFVSKYVRCESNNFF